MKRCLSILAVLSLITLFTNSTFAQQKAKAGFEKLNSLVGEWQGKGPNGLLVNISYQSLAGGTALMETRAPTNEPSMISIFHIDGDKLMMTHYCSDGNQPRMRAEVFTKEIKSLDFNFVDVTNLAKPATGHMRNLSYTFLDKDHITQVWTWRQDGKDNPAVFDLERIKVAK